MKSLIIADLFFLFLPTITFKSFTLGRTVQ